MSMTISLIVFFVLGFMTSQLVDSQKERTWKEKQDHKDLCRRFEHEMNELRAQGIDC